MTQGNCCRMAIITFQTLVPPPLGGTRASPPPLPAALLLLSPLLPDPCERSRGLVPLRSRQAAGTNSCSQQPFDTLAPYSPTAAPLNERQTPPPTLGRLIRRRWMGREEAKLSRGWGGYCFLYIFLSLPFALCHLPRSCLACKIQKTYARCTSFIEGSGSAPK